MEQVEKMVKTSLADVDAYKDDDDLQPLSLIATNLPGLGIDLYVGDKRAASDPELLAQHNIVTMLNCAVNLDINVVTSADQKGENLPYGPGFIRYYKLGIIDGPGNPTPMLLAGYYQLAGLLEQNFPTRASYPRREQGNVLILCRGGRSRSVTLAALYLHQIWKERFPTLAEAITFVSEKRGLPEASRPFRPKPVLREAAQWAAEAVELLTPNQGDR